MLTLTSCCLHVVVVVYFVASSGNVLTFHIEESRATELQLAIVQPNPDHLLSIIATTLLPLENGSLLTYTYSAVQASASLCIGGLTRATYYNVCVGTDDVIPICLQRATDPGIGGGTAQTTVGCTRPIDIVSNMPEVVPGKTDWTSMLGGKEVGRGREVCFPLSY